VVSFGPPGATFARDMNLLDDMPHKLDYAIAQGDMHLPKDHLQNSKHDG
jgi:hypothetical protein